MFENFLVYYGTGTRVIEYAADNGLGLPGEDHTTKIENNIHAYCANAT